MTSPISFHRLLRLLVPAVAGVAGTASALTVSIGTQNFADGETVTSAAFLSAVSAQPAPFNSISGGDVAGPDFTASWSFNYSAQIPGSVSAAILTVGLWDGDTAASGSQLSLLEMDGIPFTATADAVFEASQGAQGQYRVYAISLPPGVLSSLEDGVAAVTLNLRGPGLGVLGETANNGAGMDFATLELIPIPEPSLPALVFAAGLLVWRRRRTTQA